MQIQRSHSLSANDVKQRVDGIAADLGSSYGLTFKWDGDTLNFSGSGAAGRIDVSDDLVNVEIELSFGLKIMENMIRETIEDAMDKHLT